MACLAAILKGFDWEEAVLGVVALAASSQATLFDRPSHGDWLEGPDLVVAFAALALFLTFGTLSHEVSAATLERWTRIGYRFQVARLHGPQPHGAGRRCRHVAMCSCVPR